MNVITPKRLLIGGAAAVLVAGGVGTAVAATASAHPKAPVSTTVDTPEPGDTPDAAGANDSDNIQDGDQNGVDVPDTSGAADLPEAGDTADAPGQ